MNEFEERLQVYRIQEKRKHQIQRFTSILRKPLEYYRRRSAVFEVIVNNEEKLPESSTERMYERCGSPSEDDRVEEELSFCWKKFFINFLVWCCFFQVAIYVEFGAVFLLLSGFYLIWSNTRTGPKRSNELSAYSVFNPNCERIEGTLDAEKLEKEICYGMVL